MAVPTQQQRIRGAWIGRISGCMLGKPVEILSMRQGPVELQNYLSQAGAAPLRDYVPLIPDAPPLLERFADYCNDGLVAAVPDDDINYTVLSLMLLEEHGTGFTTEDVARAWFRWLPGGLTFTAERAAYAVLIAKASTPFAFGQPAGFDLDECSDNEFNDWNGATVGALWGLTGRPIPAHWPAAWNGRVQVSLAGVGELTLNDLVARTIAVCC